LSKIFSYAHTSYFLVPYFCIVCDKREPQFR